MPTVNRLNLLAAFAPPSGYELSTLVATTYSLNPTVLLAILASATLHLDQDTQTHDIESLSKEERIELVGSALKKCICICDHHGRFDSSRGLSTWDKLALESVIKFAGRDSYGQGSLHSKMILALYRDCNEQVCGRLFIGSKNFTLSNYKEFGIIYDLKSNQTGRNANFHQDLLSFLEYLRLRETKATSKGSHLKSRLQTAIEFVAKNKLSVLDQSARLLWQGRFSGKEKESIASGIDRIMRAPWERLYIHSPWTRKGAVDFFLERLPAKSEIHIKCLDEPRLSSVASKRVKYLYFTSKNGELPAGQSHSKIYLFIKGKRAGIFFGSANCTPDGLGIVSTNSKPNTEILTYLEGKAGDYKELTNFKAQSDNVARKSKFKETVCDKVLRFINSIQAEVTLVKSRNVLKYEFTSQEPPKVNKLKLVIVHELLEPAVLEGKEDIDALPVLEGRQLPTDCEVVLPQACRHRMSRLVTITAHFRGGPVSTHLVVELDPSLYEGREKLNALQFKKSELLRSLAELLNVPVPEEKEEDGGEGGGSMPRLITALTDAIRIERYALSMAKLKQRQPLMFETRLRRTEATLIRIEANKEFRNDKRFGRLVKALRGVHVLLA